MPGVNAHAGIAFFLGEVKIAAKIGQCVKPAQNILRLRFDLLDANTIGRSFDQPRLQTFAGGRPNTVEVKAG